MSGKWQALLRNNLLDAYGGEEVRGNHWNSPPFFLSDDQVFEFCVFFAFPLIFSRKFYEEILTICMSQKKEEKKKPLGVQTVSIYKRTTLRSCQEPRPAELIALLALESVGSAALTCVLELQSG